MPVRVPPPPERAVIVARSDTISDVERFLTGEAGRPRVNLAL